MAAGQAALARPTTPSATLSATAPATTPATTPAIRQPCHPDHPPGALPHGAGPGWPLGEFNAVGALLTSGPDAPSAGNYSFTLGLDDVSDLFMDGQLVLALTAGTHVMALQFYNPFCCESRLALDIGGPTCISQVPEPAAAPL